jgi:mannitol-1-phosphate 5-dehydrogenase
VMKAVHFGAGNIGRGFVGLILHEAGYEVVFVDVNAALIDALRSTPSYLVHEVGVDASTAKVDNYRALNSATHEADVVAEISTADVVTTAVGPNILRFVAPLIAKGIVARSLSRAQLAVIACENAINATDTLRAEIQNAGLGGLEKAIFANTAVDRIVPAQEEHVGLDVTVEGYFEWAIEIKPFGDDVPEIPSAHFVEDLAPFIERKLFTVNTGHATIAYNGFLTGATSISEAIADSAVLVETHAVLGETSALLVAKHSFDTATQRAYVKRNFERFANPDLTDTVERVGRQPLRKLGRNERFIGPAAQLVERGMQPVALLRAIGAALRFDVAEDQESQELKARLAELSAEDFTVSVTGLHPSHALYPLVVDEVRKAKSD